MPLRRQRCTTKGLSFRHGSERSGLEVVAASPRIDNGIHSADDRCSGGWSRRRGHGSRDGHSASHGGNTSGRSLRCQRSRVVSPTRSNLRTRRSSGTSHPQYRSPQRQLDLRRRARFGAASSAGRHGDEILRVSLIGLGQGPRGSIYVVSSGAVDCLVGHRLVPVIRASQFVDRHALGPPVMRRRVRLQCLAC